MISLVEAAYATWILLLIAVVVSAAALGVAVWIFDRDKP